MNDEISVVKTNESEGFENQLLLQWLIAKHELLCDKAKQK
jgi:hypothetical protein